MSKSKVAGTDDHEFWRMVLESHVHSGLSIQKFCEREGITPSSFYQWRKKLDSKSDTEVSSTPPPISDVSDGPTFLPIGQIHPESKPLCILFPTGIQVNVSNACNIQLLGETVRILSEQRC
jgi:hypothetical protein